MQEAGPNIQLHIERLVLDGLPIDRAQSPAIQAAVEAELSRLLTIQGFSAGFQASSAIPNLRANAIQLSSGNSPAQLGAQIAQSIHGGMSNIRCA